MIDFIIQCFAVTMSIAVAIVFIYAAIKLLSRIFEGRQVSSRTLKAGPFLEEGVQIDLRLKNGMVIEGMTFKGFSAFGEHQDIPLHFMSWVVLDGPKGRIYLKPETVRLISVRPASEA